MTEKIKIALAFIATALGIVAFYFFSDLILAGRIAIFVVSLAVAGGIMGTTEMGKGFLVFAQSASTEARKVVWPTRKETMQITGVVVALAFTMALFMWSIDALLLSLVRMIMGQ